MSLGTLQMAWINKGENGEEQYHVMYGIDGRQKLDELTLHHLRGYENSRPVRIGK